MVWSHEVTTIILNEVESIIILIKIKKDQS